MPDFECVRATALQLRNKVAGVMGYEDNIHLCSGNRRLGGLVEGIDSQKFPNAFIAQLELVIVGEIINTGVKEISDGDAGLNYLLELVGKTKERMFLL